MKSIWDHSKSASLETKSRGKKERRKRSELEEDQDGAEVSEMIGRQPNDGSALQTTRQQVSSGRDCPMIRLYHAC